MNHVDWDRVKGLYGDALDLPGGERAAFVESRTEASPEVRREVLRLLGEERRMGGFLDSLTVVGRLVGGPQSVPPHVFAEGQVVAGRYRVDRRIRAGGMGEVYEAYDLELEQRIALKTIRPEIARDPDAISRFRREVAIARRVTHPNVCRVFDFGDAAGPGSEPVAYFSMEFLVGETLADRLKRSGPLTSAQALPCVRQILDALDAAHRVDVVHRDLKPGNVMLVPDANGGERAVVTDFGIARSVAANEGDATKTGIMAGTPDYMAPEQSTGGTVTPATDLYAFGVVMHETLTGQKPSGKCTPGMIADKRWAAVIDSCLERDPRARPQSAGEVLDSLSGKTGESPTAVWRWVLAASIFLALALGLFRLYNRKAVTPSATAAIHIAVLPFRVVDQDLQVFADGLMEAITQRLSQYEGINRAVKTASARETRKAVKSAGEAKTLFGADYAVEGSLHAQQGRLRLVLSVIDTGNLQQVESISVEGSRDRVFVFQDQAVSSLATVFNLKVQPKHAAEMNRVSPVDPGAYDFYLQAKGYLQRNDRIADVNSAITLLNRSLDLNQGEAAAHAALGEAYWFKYERTSDPQWVAKALAECRKALSLDGHLSESRVTMGRILIGTGRYREAIQEFQNALAVDPRLLDAYHGLGRAYFEAKDPAAAEGAYRKAIELSSRDWHGYKELGLFYYRQSNYRQAIEQFQRVVSLSPDNASAYNNLGGLYGLIGEKDKAREMLEKAIGIEPDRISTLTNLTKLLFDEGRHQEALLRWNKAVERNPSSYVLWGNLGAAYLKAARQDDANRSFSEAARLTSAAIGVNPQRGELYSYRAHFLAPLGKKRETLADLEKSGSLAGRDLEMLIRDAVSLVMIGRSDRAALYVKAAIAHGYSPQEGLRNQYLRDVVGQLIGSGADR